MKFKECPFCKNKDQDEFTFFFSAIGRGAHQVMCLYCGAKGPYASSEASATKRWNRGIKR
jgi:Lar family restriction alleviation protein